MAGFFGDSIYKKSGNNHSLFTFEQIEAVFACSQQIYAISDFARLSNPYGKFFVA